MDKYWHSFWLRLHEVILDSCLCEVERMKITTKIHYHRTKLYT